MAEVTRTQSPSVVNNQGQNVDPAQWNPDMATMAMMKDLIKKWPTPTIVNARFTVFHGVWTALNHVDPTYKDVLISDPAELDRLKYQIVSEIAGKPGYFRIMINPGNPTYYDCSYRLSVYQGAGNQSVNKDGKLFNSIFAFAMKPQYIIQGMPLLSGENEQKPGLLSRAWSSITGRGQQQQQTNGSPK